MANENKSLKAESVDTIQTIERLQKKITEMEEQATKNDLIEDTVILGKIDHVFNLKVRLKI